MDMKRRILSCFLAFCMIFALLPAPAQAAGNAENATETVTATVQHAATGQITAQIEAYMTDSANKTRTVKPCDIIFLIEQSQFMNTQNGSASSGDERAEILSAIDRLLDGMPQPTTGGAHRIAIAGYGRINNPGRSDIYDATLYPGTPSDNNDSLNTGYYTKDDTKGVFHSQSGWTEWNKIDGHTDATLPQLPSGYLPDDYNYDDVFLSVDNAKQVIDADKMVPWYAGAARMDAGLTITEQLAKIAKAEADSKDRNLIVCIAASSLPYQNSGTYQKLRPDAAIEAANTLKETYSATIFGLGDFNKLTLESGNPLNDPDEQRKNFNDTMASICGNASTHGADYFKGLSQVHDIDEALNELMTKIDANVGEGAAEKLSIHVDHFTEGAGGYSWSQLKDGHHILSAGSIREVASVDYYRFTGYDSSGTPQFESTPSRHTEQSLADIGRGNAIQTSLNILPIPPQAKADETIRGANYGEKVVITITDPVCIDYDWIGRWRPDFLAPPKHEHAARGTTHKPAAPTQNAVAGKDLNLKFDGWYRLWDETIDQDKPTWEYNGNTYVKYTGTVFPAFGSDLKLYGRWLPEIQVSFHWAGSVIPVDGDGNEIAAPAALSLSLNGDGNRYYKATAPTADGFEFDGWYKDSDCTQKFQEGGEYLTANTNLYGRWTRLGTKTVTFKVQNGKWSNGTAEDNTVTVELRNGLGTLSAKDVPTGMTPDTDHKAPGAWDSHPNTNTDGISETGNYVYTYTFPQKDECTVTYHWVSTENPDSAALPPQATVTEGTTYTVETVPDIKGWTFSGWYDNEACEGKRVDKEINIKDQNIDLYGKWTHNPCTVTFRADYEGAERGYLDANKQTVVLTYTVPYGSTLRKERISLPTPVPGEATYYFFKDWDLDNLFYTDPDVLDMPVRSDLTFVAQWWPVVTFDANGGAWSSVETIETMHYVKIQTDTEKVAAESTPVRNGYTFLGWYTDDGNRANFEDTVNGPKTLYAHWAKNAAVTFRIVNGTWSGGAAEDKTVTVVLYPQADGTASGTLDASYVPQIMLPAPGYENIAGGWEQTPNTDPNGITGDVTYVYRFGSTGGGSSSGHSTRYTLHYESNGGTAYKDERCSSGTKVTLDKTPTRESYTFTGWYADKALTQKITSVTMNSDKTVYAGWEATGVPDKLNGDDHFAYVVGYSDSTVRPNANISRAEVATIFFRLLKSDIRDGNLTADNEFSDVSDGQWHNKAISTMAKLGIVKGRRADRFDPDASITRAEFAAICARFSTRSVENSSSFSDISGHWAENEIERAAAFGWISGYPDGTFRPDARITRAEAMTMINRVLCRMPQSESDLLDSMVTWPDNKPSDWHYLSVQEATNSHDFNRQGEVGESWTKLTSVPDWTRYQ
ncbi:InlB B-repeat-containing protein [Agathobaculum butyriciproducens]|uniref:InlB B-repeat-containing protein n=1 Tax=Agathobaculum butyriciproducens TaxID=1628085 RepID=UPI0020986097|nr:InlB B-repeat-containing protein [Agathobaculum butyriciproducens]